ncbi:hypothetical protein SBRCBS47491_000689 [Sporothrix bragantina]|uniref:EVE domain-containing protein n=1 Tax=Sporothrix bragantina TaxID=671064 RepID=A0ABP0ASP4_9PEZI
MPPKRKADAESTPLRRSTRTRSQAAPEPEPESQSTPTKKARTAQTTAEQPAPKKAAASRSRASAGPSTEAGPSTQSPATATTKKSAAKPKTSKKGKGRAVTTKKEEEEEEEPEASQDAAAPSAASSTTAVPAPPAAAAAPQAETDDADRGYWLLKAEPESRFENGVDVRFSIDDLAACTAPEPWDGIRNYAARNNLRKMKKGDLAFFYHSNTKEPGIVGTMTIVQEHSPDLTAHDPKTAYYDPNAAADAAAGKDPKWSVVHVQFRSKFAHPITLRDLRAMGGPGQPLESMQMLKQTRLSVSRVSAAEWKHLMGVAKAT